MKNGRTNTSRACLYALTLCLMVAGFASSAYSQTAGTTYKGAKSDPFNRYKPPVKRKVEKKVAMPVPAPDLQARINSYKAKKLAAMNLQQPAPKPTSALTLGEIQVTGIFRTPRGYAAMVEATPIKLSYVVYPGEQFFDGMLVAIEETRLVFRRQTRWSDGRVEVAVDTKQLRQPSASDSLTTQKTSAAGGEATSSGSKSDVNALVEALKALAASAQSQNQSQPPAQPGQEVQGSQGSVKP